ncbi:MAG: response regulator, partial [Deltaproteobacteria bacterium]|nr:response regulator [Deltaproteobacteria bacterium]
IRTPINNVIGTVEMAFDAKPSKEVAKCLEMVEGSAKILLTVINDILDFSKIEAGKMHIELIKLDLGEFLEQAITPLKANAEKKGIRFSLDIDDDVPKYIKSDGVRLAQILNNLIGNAMKFTKKQGGIINVRVSSLKPDSRSGIAQVSSQIHFSIEDNGIGIPKDKHKSIFESFSQADESTTRQFGGTGLGLTIAAQLSRLLGGDIWVESVVNEGSTFHFTISAGKVQEDVLSEIDPHSAKSEQPHANRDSKKSCRILVVDDNEMGREIARHRLEKWGHIVSLAINGREAVERFSEETFDLILMDCQMPVMDGYQATREIRQLERSRGNDTSGTPIPILAMTANATDGAEGGCLEAGMDYYISKPVNEEELISVIDKYVENAVNRDNSVYASASSASTTTKEEDEKTTEIPSAISPHVQEQRSNSHTPCRILVVDDNEMGREIARHRLEKWGHSVAIAANGEEAVERFKQEKFDLIFMDCEMPVMDGLTATKLIRQLEQNGHGKHFIIRIPILAMTANEVDRAESECLEAGMDAYVSKPIKESELTNAINRFVSERQQNI